MERRHSQALVLNYSRQRPADSDLLAATYILVVVVAKVIISARRLVVDKQGQKSRRVLLFSKTGLCPEPGRQTTLRGLTYSLKYRLTRHCTLSRTLSYTLSANCPADHCTPRPTHYSTHNCSHDYRWPSSPSYISFRTPLHPIVYTSRTVFRTSSQRPLAYIITRLCLLLRPLCSVPSIEQCLKDETNLCSVFVCSNTLSKLCSTGLCLD